MVTTSTSNVVTVPESEAICNSLSGLPSTNHAVIIRLQNLAWEARSHDIRQFFSGLIIPDGGVHIIGGPEGDAFIAFQSDEDARKAMLKTGQQLCGNQIRLLLSSKNEMYGVIAQAKMASPYFQMASAIPNFGGAVTPNVCGTQPSVTLSANVHGGIVSGASNETSNQLLPSIHQESSAQWYRPAQDSPSANVITFTNDGSSKQNAEGRNISRSVESDIASHNQQGFANEGNLLVTPDGDSQSKQRQMNAAEVQQRLSDMLTSAAFRGSQDVDRGTTSISGNANAPDSSGNNHAVALNFAQQLFSLLEMNTPSATTQPTPFASTHQPPTTASLIPDSTSTYNQMTNVRHHGLGDQPFNDRIPVTHPISKSDLNQLLLQSQQQNSPLISVSQHPSHYPQQSQLIPPYGLIQSQHAMSTVASQPFPNQQQFRAIHNAHHQLQLPTISQIPNLPSNSSVTPIETSLPTPRQLYDGPYPSQCSNNFSQSLQPRPMFQAPNPDFTSTTGTSSLYTPTSQYPSSVTPSYGQQTTGQGPETRSASNVNFTSLQLKGHTQQQPNYNTQPVLYNTPSASSEFGIPAHYGTCSPFINAGGNNQSLTEGHSLFNHLLGTVTPQQPQMYQMGGFLQQTNAQPSHHTSPLLQTLGSRLTADSTGNRLQPMINIPAAQPPRNSGISSDVSQTFNLEKLAPPSATASRGLLQVPVNSAGRDSAFCQNQPRGHTGVDAAELCEPFLRLSGLTEHPYRQIHHLLYPTLRIRLRDIKLINDANGKCTGCAVICFNCVEDAKSGYRMVANRANTESLSRYEEEAGCLAKIKVELCTEYDYVCAVDSYIPASVRKQASDGFYAVRIIGFSFRWDKRDIRRYFEGVNFHSRDKILVLQTDHRQPSHNIAIAIMATELDLERALFYDNEDTGHGKLSVTAIDKNSFDLETSSARYRQQQRSTVDEKGRDLAYTSSRASSSQRGLSWQCSDSGREVPKRVQDDNRDSPQRRISSSTGVLAGTGNLSNKKNFGRFDDNQPTDSLQIAEIASPSQSKRFRAATSIDEKPKVDRCIDGAPPRGAKGSSPYGSQPVSYRAQHEGGNGLTVVKLSGFPLLYSEEDIKNLLQRAGLLSTGPSAGPHEPELVMVDIKDQSDHQQRQQGSSALLKFCDQNQCRRALGRARHILSSKSIEAQIMQPSDDTFGAKDTKCRFERPSTTTGRGNSNLTNPSELRPKGGHLSEGGRAPRESRFSSPFGVPVSLSDQAKSSNTSDGSHRLGSEGSMGEMDRRRRPPGQPSLVDSSERAGDRAALTSQDQKQRMGRHGGHHFPTQQNFESAAVGSDKFRSEYHPSYHHHPNRHVSEREGSQSGRFEFGGVDNDQHRGGRRDNYGAPNEQSLPASETGSESRQSRFSQPDRLGGRVDFNRINLQRDSKLSDHLSRTVLNEAGSQGSSQPLKRPLLPDPVQSTQPTGAIVQRGAQVSPHTHPLGRSSFPNSDNVMPSQGMRGCSSMHHRSSTGSRRAVPSGPVPVPRNLPPIPPELEQMSGQILLLDNVPYRATKEDILSWLVRFRPLEETLKIRHDDIGRPTGHAIVALQNPRAAEAASQMLPGSPLLGRHIHVILM